QGGGPFGRRTWAEQGGWRPRPGLFIGRTARRLRRPGPPGNVTRAANKVAARPRRESRTTGSTGTSRKIATVERREASVPFSLGTQASRTRRRAPVMARRSGCLAGTRAPVGAPHPLAGWKRKFEGERRGKRG